MSTVLAGVVLVGAGNVFAKHDGWTMVTVSSFAAEL